MTWAEVVYEISSMRSKGLTDRQVKQWVTRLERWDPEHVKREADKLTDSWELASDWPIGVLIRKLGRPDGDAEAEPFDGFLWSPADGKTWGNWEKFWALPEDERYDVACHALKWGQTELAQRMYPGVQARIDKDREALTARVTA